MLASDDPFTVTIILFEFFFLFKYFNRLLWKYQLDLSSRPCLHGEDRVVNLHDRGSDDHVIVMAACCYMFDMYGGPQVPPELRHNHHSNYCNRQSNELASEHTGNPTRNTGKLLACSSPLLTVCYCVLLLVLLYIFSAASSDLQGRQ
jgi:hypothetical protein